MAEAYLELECGRAMREEHVEGYWADDDGWQEAHTIRVPYGPGHRIPLGEIFPDAQGVYHLDYDLHTVLDYSALGLPQCPLCGADARYVRVEINLPDKPHPATSSSTSPSPPHP